MSSRSEHPAASPPDTEEWFRTLAETTSTAIFVYRRELIYVNAAGEELTGYTAEELAGMELARLAHPDFAPFIAERMQARMSGDMLPAHFDLKIVRKNGEERWIHINAAGLVVDGRPAALSTAVDITDRKLAELELLESRARLELAQRAAGLVTWEWDLLTDELKLSAYAAELLGAEPERIWRSGTEFMAAVTPEDQEMVADALRRCQKDEDTFGIQFRVRTPDGRLRWISERAQVIRDASGTATRFIGVAHDISSRKRAEEALHEEKERAQVTLASIGDGVIRTDAEGRVDYMNPVAERLTGWPAAEAMGQPLLRVFNVVDEGGGRPLFNPVDRCLREGRVIELPGPSILLRRNGGEHAIRDSVAPIRDVGGRITGTVLVFKDVTELRGMEREMSFLARHDALTGLVNRREFEALVERCLETAQEEGRQHALCYIDLDEFKLVNDTCGHLAGDELLKQLAAAMTARLRRADVLARLGGDEFGVLLEDTPPKRARAIAEDLRAAVRELRFVWQERIFEVGASIGLVPITAGSGDLAQVLSAADAACYVAKESGRNRIHEYQPDDTAVALRYGEMQWIHRIHKAFEDGRFCLYQQPITPLSGSGAPFCEIFIRMRDEAGQLVSPAAFIPAAERYHLIPAIDRWVVRTAFAALAARRAGEPDGVFAINLSGQTLSDEDFLDYIMAELAASGLPGSSICFEITETAAIANLARATRFMNALKALGCRFVLDDFGSGLSSFAYLKNLRVDFLKIDGEFVRDMAVDPIERALVASINQIGHVMGISTIAEGVEDRATLDALREVGVDYAQGYVIALPEPLP